MGSKKQRRPGAPVAVFGSRISAEMTALVWSPTRTKMVTKVATGSSRKRMESFPDVIEDVRVDILDAIPRAAREKKKNLKKQLRAILRNIT